MEDRYKPAMLVKKQPIVQSDPKPPGMIFEQ
jgi:hypothetical protein